MWPWKDKPIPFRFSRWEERIQHSCGALVPEPRQLKTETYEVKQTTLCISCGKTKGYRMVRVRHDYYGRRTHGLWEDRKVGVIVEANNHSVDTASPDPDHFY